MAKLRVRLHIDKLRPEDVGSTVRVAVLDTSQADELHSTVAEATTTVPADSDHIDVVIELPDDALEKRRRYSLWGHVDHEGTGHMAPGDLIITQNIPVTLDNIRNGAAAIEAKLTRI